MRLLGVDKLQNWLSRLGHPASSRGCAGVESAESHRVGWDAGRDSSDSGDVWGLITDLSNLDPDIRENAVITLHALGPKAEDSVPSLIQLYDKTDITIRILILDALENIGIGASAAIPLLRGVSLDRSRNISERIKARSTLDTIELLSHRALQ